MVSETDAALRAVRIGDWVRVRDGELEEWLRLVDPVEADPRRRWYSCDTPIGQALLGRTAGQPVEVGRSRSGRWLVAVVDVEPVPSPVCVRCTTGPCRTLAAVTVVWGIHRLLRLPYCQSCATAIREDADAGIARTRVDADALRRLGFGPIRYAGEEPLRGPARCAGE